MSSYKDHPFYRQMLQSQRNRRKPVYRSKYSTASTADGSQTERMSVDDYFAQGKTNHDQLKQMRILQEYQEKQRLTNQAPNKNAIGIVVPESDRERLKRFNEQQVALLPEHLQPMALKILNEETEVRIQTDKVKEKLHTARTEVKDDIKYLTNIVQKVYDAENKFKENITKIGIERGVYDKYGNPIMEGETTKPSTAPQQKVVKTLAFGKIHAKVTK